MNVLLPLLNKLTLTMFYLIYLSSATHLYTGADLAGILEKARQNNTSMGVTGLLLYHDGSILQILEGDEDTVKSLYTTIAKDSRHRNIIKMVTGTCDERHFPDWSMGFKAVTDTEWDEFTGYLTLDPSGILSRLQQKNQKINTMVNSFFSVNVRK